MLIKTFIKIGIPEISSMKDYSDFYLGTNLVWQLVNNS